MLFVSNTHSYVPIKLCRVARSIHLFKIRGRLNPENVKLKKNWIWDVLEIDWSDISITLNDNEIGVPSSVIIPFTERYRARRLLRKHPLLFYNMLKQGKTWFSLVLQNLEIPVLLSTIIERILNEDIRHDVITLSFLFLDNNGKIANSRCDFENGFFSCDLPEDAVLLILKVKMKMGNHTLVEDTEKWTEKFHP